MLEEWAGTKQLFPKHLPQTLSRLALTGLSQWLEHRSEYQKVLGSIPSQSCVPVLQVPSQAPVECMWEATNQCVSLTYVFLCLSPHPSHSFSLKINGKNSIG